MSATEIRERQDSDIPALAAALVAVHKRDGYPVEGVADPVAWLDLDQPLGAWTATLDGQPVGQVALTKPGSGDDSARLLRERDDTPPAQIAVLGRLFVSPEARGHNLGRRLTETAMYAARTAGLRAVLDVMAKDTAAISLYDHLGWRPLGSIEHHYGAHRVEPAVAYEAP